MQSEGQVTVSQGAERRQASWIVVDGVIRVRIGEHTREAPIGGMAAHPEPMAKLLAAEIAKTHYPPKPPPSHWSRRPR